MTNKLTEGPIIKSLLALAIPIILANILQTAYQLTDTFWVGRLGADAVASISISFPIIFLLISMGGGLTMAGTILVAQYRGRNDMTGTNHVATQTFLMTLVISIALSAIGYAVTPYLMKIMGAEPAVFAQAVSYMRISFLGLFFMFSYFVYQSLMNGIGKVKIPLYLVCGTVTLNLFFDPLFIMGYGPIPAFGVSGAALATIGTQGIAGLIGIFLLFLGKHGIKIKFSELKPDFKLIKKLFFLGFPASIEQSTRALGMTIMVLLVTSFGTITTAAYGIGTRVLGLVIIPALGLSMATSTLVGQNIGAGKTDRAAKIAKISTLIGFIGLTALGILLFVIAKPLSAAFIPDETEVIISSALFIKIMALSFGFLGVQQILSGALRGAGSTMITMALSIISLWILRFPLAYILSHNTSLGEKGLWWAFPISNVIGAIITVAWFAKGTWKEKKITEDRKRAEKVTEETMIEEGVM